MFAPLKIIQREQQKTLFKINRISFLSLEGIEAYDK